MSLINSGRAEWMLPVKTGTGEFYDADARETYPAFEVSLEFPPGAYYCRV
jgi:hypothetical protein